MTSSFHKQPPPYGSSYGLWSRLRRALASLHPPLCMFCGRSGSMRVNSASVSSVRVASGKVISRRGPGYYWERKKYKHYLGGICKNFSENPRILNKSYYCGGSGTFKFSKNIRTTFGFFHFFNLSDYFFTIRNIFF